MAREREAIDEDQLGWEKHDPEESPYDRVERVRATRRFAQRRKAEALRPKPKVGLIERQRGGLTISEHMGWLLSRLDRISFAYKRYVRGDDDYLDIIFERAVEDLSPEKALEFTGPEVDVQVVVMLKKHVRKVKATLLKIPELGLAATPGMSRRGEVAILLVAIDPEGLVAMDIAPGAATVIGAELVSSRLFRKIAQKEIVCKVCWARRRKDRIDMY